MKGRTHLVVPHVRFGAVQQPLKLEPVRVPVCDHVADLADDGREDEHADQVADDREHVPWGEFLKSFGYCGIPKQGS